MDSSTLNPGDGIILQMMDTDDSTVGGFNPFGEFLHEDAGVPSVSGNETGATKTCETVIMPLTNGEYEGNFSPSGNTPLTKTRLKLLEYQKIK